MTVIELINLLERMPDDVDVALAISSDKQVDISSVLYDPDRDAVLLIP